MSSHAELAETTLPPRSPLRKYSFQDIEVLARYAVFVDGDPRKLYCYDARKIDFDEPGEWIRPPASIDDRHDNSDLGAYWYQASSGDVVCYYLENMALYALGDSHSTEEWTDDSVPFDRLPPFAACLSLVELHELCHWAIGDGDEQPGMDDTEHWGRWDNVLAAALSYVWDGDLEWYQPGDEDLWYSEENENGVRTPAGVWLTDDAALESDRSEQMTLEDGW